MQKIYSRINWENDPSTNTAINEDNLNKMDYALDQIDNRVVNLAGYETRVAESEVNAKTSETNAAQSEANAKEYEESAVTSATASQTSASVAEARANNAKASETNALAYSQNAKNSENAAATSEQNAKASEASALIYAQNAKSYAEQINGRIDEAVTSAENAAKSEANAGTQALVADEKAELAEQHALMAESYTHGSTGLRTNEAVDNAQYYLEQAKQLSQSSNGLIPMGTISFANLSLAANQIEKYMFNISDAFVTDATFKEGAGHSFPAGTNVFRTNDGYWDCLAGSFQTPNGDTKDNVVTFTQASTRANIASGEKFSVIFGKIAKLFADLKTVAFTGSYTDLSNKPTIPTNTWRPLGTTADTACAGNDSRLSNARPASDVYSWAKASSKPSYTKSEVGLGNVPNVATNNQTPTFSVASTRANIVSGETLTVILGKVMKFFADLKTVAFTGSYTDLSNKPSIPSSVKGTQIKYQYLPTTTTNYTVSLGDYDFYTILINLGGTFRNSLTLPAALFKDGSIKHEVIFMTGGAVYWAEFQYINSNTVSMVTNYTSSVIAYIYGYKLA